MKTIKTIFLSVFVLGVLLQTGWAQKDLVIGVESINYYPLFTIKNGKYMGFAREFFDSFGRHSGYRIWYEGLPVKRLYKNLFNGQVDFKFPDNPYWKADIKKGKSIFYSKGIVDYIDGVLVLPENKGKGIKKLDLLGTILGFTPWDFQDEIESRTIRLVEKPGFQGLLNQVMKKKLSGAYVNITVANHILEHIIHKPGRLIFDPSLPHTKANYKVSTVKHVDILQELNEYMDSNRFEIQQLKLKYRVQLD